MFSHLLKQPVMLLWCLFSLTVLVNFDLEYGGRSIEYRETEDAVCVW
jgi:hypothetical protein